MSRYKKKRKLEDYLWLEASMNSFNGSGYADRTNAQTFMSSYLAYQMFRGREYGQLMADKYWQAGLEYAEFLVSEGNEPAMIPNYRNFKEFSLFYPDILKR